MRAPSIAFATVIGLTSGCVIGEEPNGENEPEIIGGVTDSGDPAVGLVRSVIQTNFYGAPVGVATCTGTLIAPNIMLTAAHCYSPDARWVDVSFATQPNLFAGFGSFTSAQVIPHPQYNGDGRQGHDVAIVALADWSSTTPKARAATPGAGGTVRAVGYGMNVFGNNAAGAGIKREALLAVRSVAQHEFVSGVDGLSTCHGDSGGPLFNGAGIAGIVSYGDTVDCHGSGHNMRVDDNLDFIRQYVPNF